MRCLGHDTIDAWESTVMWSEFHVMKFLEPEGGTVIVY